MVENTIINHKFITSYLITLLTKFNKYCATSLVLKVLKQVYQFYQHLLAVVLCYLIKFVCSCAVMASALKIVVIIYR